MQKCIILAFSLLFLSSGVRSQTTVEVSRITCDQFFLHKIKDPQKIAIWLSGYYNGMRKNTTLDVSVLEERAETLKDFCYSNPKVYVMDAAERVFRPSNIK